MLSEGWEVPATVEPYIVDRAAFAAEAEGNFRHPRFDEAVARYAAAGMDPPSVDPRLAKLVRHVARYTLAVAVLYLDATGGPNGGGATAANLRQMLTTGGFASDGWVKNAVRVFARAGYFYRYPASGDRRTIRVAPSGMMIRIAQELMAPKLAATRASIAAAPAGRGTRPSPRDLSAPWRPTALFLT